MSILAASITTQVVLYGRTLINQTAYLLSIYDKSRKNNISDKELDELLHLAGL